MDVNVDSAFCCPASSFRIDSCWREELEFRIEMSLDVSSNFLSIVLTDSARSATAVVEMKFSREFGERWLFF